MSGIKTLFEKGRACYKNKEYYKVFVILRLTAERGNADAQRMLGDYERDEKQKNPMRKYLTLK
ncbi:hypothetical protein K4L44_04555 [Halosquirtibacter laminarini]|uniref:Uncharacterized protein n=1 Tax=Halosquirtibacter laminarini TaxID=3374600 RepID=A0AC61NKH1_9BACT|nr:hypothetical protein K4L44_04555 [Prolixibacteraceae bacterium]